MAGMDCGASTTCPGTNNKAAEAKLDEALSGADTAAPAPASLCEGQGSAAEEPAAAPRRPKEIMSQEWIDSLLSKEHRPLPFTERHLRDPKLAAIFEGHERSRAKFAAYQDSIRRELETKGYVEVDDDFDERCQLLEAVSTASFYGREEEADQAIAKLSAMRLRRRSIDE